MKSAAKAGYYFQGWLEQRHGGRGPETSRGLWLRRPVGLGFAANERRESAPGELLSCPVTTVDLDRLLRRRTIDSGETPTFNFTEGSSGYDFVFSAPKSVSILWALNKDARDGIEKAHERAVEGAVDVLVRHAIRERLGKGGHTLGPAEAAVAVFFHDKCRAAYHPELKGDADRGLFPDPHLHSHVVVPDIVVGMAGRSPPENKPAKPLRLKVAYTALYARWVLALGAWYHARLAFELRSLKIAVSASGRAGLFQIQNMKPNWIRAFSARTEGAKCLDGDFVGALAKTRQPRQMVWPGIETRWCALAEAVGIDLSVALQGRGAGATTKEHSRDDTRDKSAESVLREAVINKAVKSLAETDAVAQLPDLYRAVAVALVEADAPLLPDHGLIDELLARRALVPLRPTASHGLSQWTTRSNLNAERQVTAAARRLSAEGFLSAKLAERDRTRFVCSPAQWRAARSLAGAHRLVVLCGAPGSGKTQTIAPVVEAYRRQHGLRVIVAAEAWRTALDAGQRCGADQTYSLASLFARRRRDRLPGFDARCMLIVEEAGLLSTSRMRQLLAAVSESGVKLILVGDSAQLNPIGAGSGLELARKSVAAITLDELKRPQNPGQLRVAQALEGAVKQRGERGAARAATAELATLCLEGDVHHSVAQNLWRAYPSSHDASEAVAREVVDALVAGRPPERVVALTRSHREAQHVTRLAQRLLRERGHLSRDIHKLRAVTPMGVGYTLHLGAGDRIRFLARHPGHGVVNGTRGVVTAIRQTGATAREMIELNVEVFDAACGASRSIVVRPHEFDDGEGRMRIACDYASTIFGSQGATHDEVVILRSRSMTFRELYVALTRARRRALVVDVDANRARMQAAVENQQFQPYPGLRKALHAALLADLLASQRHDRGPRLAVDALAPARRKDPPRGEWLWDALAIDRDVAFTDATSGHGPPSDR